MIAYVLNILKDLSKCSEHEIRYFDKADPFIIPDEDFFVVTRAEGKKILASKTFKKSIGLFSSNKIGNDTGYVLSNSKLVGKQEIDDYIDQIYFHGGAYFKKIDLNIGEKFDTVDLFLKKNIDKLEMDHCGVNKVPALFLDRDGIINEDCGYPSSINQIQLISEIVPIIALANKHQWPVLVLTNQSGIAREYLSTDELDIIHQHIAHELNLQGAQIDRFYHCPYHPKGSDKKYAYKSMLRKPNPLMALIAADDFDVD